MSVCIDYFHAGVAAAIAILVRTTMFVCIPFQMPEPKACIIPVNFTNYSYVSKIVIL